MDEAKVSGLAAGEAYISGALTGIEDAPRMKLFYELLAEIAGAAKLRPYLPHRVTDPVATARLDPRAVYEIDGEAASVIRDAVASGRLFGAGLRDLVGRYALRGGDLGAFILRDVLERPLAETARALGIDPRTARSRLGTARSRVGLPEDAAPDLVAQWLVTELIAPPTRALQLHLFTGNRA